MLELKPFSRGDWYGFSGSEPFPDGSEPLIGTLPVWDEDGTAVTTSVIVDAAGVAILGLTEEGEDRFTVVFAGAFATRAVAQLRPGLTFTELSALPGASVERAEVES